MGDHFIHDHITPEDYLVVSIGGNDIALRPSACTIANMLTMVRCTSKSCFRSLFGFVWPPGIGYFVDLFGNAVQNYVLRVLGDKRPKKVLVCMIYFLDEQGTSWADRTLDALDYNENPGRLQEAIRVVFRLATQRISIPGTEVIAFPLFDVLDGKDSTDYVSRVEPSPSGGEKMAKALMTTLLGGGLPQPRRVE